MVNFKQVESERMGGSSCAVEENQAWRAAEVNETVSSMITETRAGFTVSVSSNSDVCSMK